MNARTILAAVVVIVVLIGAAGAWLLLGGKTSPPAPPAPRGLAIQPTTTASSPNLIYAARFEDRADAAWTRRNTDRTPSGVPFLGPFGNESVGLVLHSLPAHDYLRLSFDLFIIDTWDGIGRISAAGGPCGPDFWMLELESGPTLARGTFSTLPPTGNFAEDGKLQTWPWAIPSTAAPAGTGAEEVNGLGYVFKFGNIDATFPMDGRYRVSVLVPHQAPEVAFRLSGSGLQGINDESWGIADVSLEALSRQEVESASPQALGDAWADLLGDDPSKSQPAFRTLVAGHNETVELIRNEVRTFGVPAEVLAALRTALAGGGGPDADALRLIARHGPPLEPLLRQSLRGEVLTGALCEIEVYPSETPLRRCAAAAARLLQVINTPEAQSLHQRLLDAGAFTLDADSAAYAGEWKSRVLDAYDLRHEQAVKFVPFPAIPERARFLAGASADVEHDSAGSLPAAVAVAPDKPYLFGMASDGSHRFLWRRPAGELPDGGVEALIRYLEAQGDRVMGTPPVVVDPALQDIRLQGDWVMQVFTGGYERHQRAETARRQQSARLKALMEIIEQQTGRRLRLVSDKIDSRFIVIRGKWPAEYARDKVVELRPDPSAPEPEREPSETSSGYFMNVLEHRLGIPVVDESSGSPRRLRWRFRTPGGRWLSNPTDAQIDHLLRDLAEQTSLSMKIETRPAEIFRVVEQ